LKAASAADTRQGDEIVVAIRALTDAQWTRLRSASRYYAWAIGWEAEDLLNETFCRTLAGSRRCPIDVDLVRFLVQAMRSIAGGEAEKITIENQAESVPIVQPGAAVAVAIDLADARASEEEAMLIAENEEAIRQGALGLFQGDATARDLVDGILMGYEGEELRILTSLDKTAYASKRRLVRRAFNRLLAGRKES
jgi:hypothetical protein